MRFLGRGRGNRQGQPRKKGFAFHPLTVSSITPGRAFDHAIRFAWTATVGFFHDNHVRFTELNSASQQPEPWPGRCQRFQLAFARPDVPRHDYSGSCLSQPAHEQVGQRDDLLPVPPSLGPGPHRSQQRETTARSHHDGHVLRRDDHGLDHAGARFTQGKYPNEGLPCARQFRPPRSRNQ